MKKLFKKVLFLLVFVATVFVFVGCGNKEYAVSYDLDGGECENLVEIFNSKDGLDFPIPSKEGFTFIGWYQDGKLVNESGNSNLTLKAKWLEDSNVFKDNYFVYDGSPKSMVVSFEVPSYLTIEYKDNTYTELGKYYPTAILKDLNGNELKSYRNTMIIDITENPEFKQLMDELLVDMFEGDQMSVNFFFKDYTLFGIEHSEAGLPKAEEYDFEEDMAETLAFIEELKAFDVNTLNLEQKDCLEFVLYLFENSSKYTENMTYMTNDYLGSYLGYQANLPLELAEYKFYTEQDVIDFLGYLEDAPAAFKSYYEFACKQAEKGYGMTNIVINNVISQCEKFVNIKETNYLIDIFNEKVDKCDFLTDTQKSDYKVQAKTLIQGTLTDAYDYIKNNLNNLLGKSTNNGGLARYGEEGKKLYEVMLQGELGYKDLTGDEAIAYVEEKMNKYYNLMFQTENAAKSSDSSTQLLFEKCINGLLKYSEYKYDELLDYYKEAASKFVPDLPIQPEITISYVPKSLQENFSPACYFVSPLDVKNKESIYLNGAYTDDYNYVFITLAHEGYPGHLYQYSYAKELNIHNLRKVIRNSGYTEGWATYMEINAYDFAVGFDSKGRKLGLQYLKYSDTFWGLLNVRIDLGIHYEGWTIEDMCDWMNGYFGYPSDAGYQPANLQAVYDQVAEIPTNFSKYFYAYSLLLDMHDKAQEELGDAFDEVLLNKCLLDYGALPLEMLEAKVDEFIADQKILNGIQ